MLRQRFLSYPGDPSPSKLEKNEWYDEVEETDFKRPLLISPVETLFIYSLMGVILMLPIVTMYSLLKNFYF